MKQLEFLAHCKPVADLVAKKDEDYNTGVALERYFPFGDASYVHMLNTKVLRLTSLVKEPRGANFESKLDTAQDLLAYTVFYLAHLQADDTALGADRIMGGIAE